MAGRDKISSSLTGRRRHSRQHLLDNLHTLLPSQPLTLLSAPAGYGKTTLLAALSPTYPDLSVAWLSLDEEDNDPVRFLTALIVALQHLNPTCGATAQSLLTSHTHPGAEMRRVTSVLINDVLETLSDPFALILDDLHLVTQPAIFVALDYLPEHSPPQLRLVVATRVDPPLALARLRACGQVAELRLAKLRFTVEEAAAFLNDRLSLALSPDDLGVLQAHTEGWPVGLRLLRGSLDRLPATADRSGFIQHLAQTDRYVFDFLAEEVLNRQESAVRTFLLETAILPELTPALCQAVTRRADAGTMLEQLCRRNLFLVATNIQLGSESGSSLGPQLPSPPTPQPSHRYHDLFAEFLQQRLQQEMPERVPNLHLRAARAQSAPGLAVSHYLAAARWSEAAEIIIQIGAEMFTRGYLDTLNRWINMLTASVSESHPRLPHYLGRCAFWKGAWEEAQTLLEQALQGFEAADDEAGQGEVLANLALNAAWPQSDFKLGSALFDRALTHPAPPHAWIQSLLGRASLKLTLGDWAQAE